MTHTPTDWSNPDDPAVRAALAVACHIGGCNAQPGQHCASIVDNQPLPGRIVHHFREDGVIGK